MEVDAPGSVSGLHSLAAWLRQHGPHLRQLNLQLWLPAGVNAGAPAVVAAVAACLTAAAAAEGLTDLSICGCLPPSTEWLAPQQPLRRLVLMRERARVEDAGQPHSPPFELHQPLDITPAIAQLTALESLSLHGSGVSFSPGVRLPATLTHLKIYGGDPVAVQQAG